MGHRLAWATGLPTTLGISACWRQGHGEEDIGLGVRMDLSCRDFTGSALTWNEGKNLARGKVVAFETELWNGALELWKQSPTGGV